MAGLPPAGRLAWVEGRAAGSGRQAGEGGEGSAVRLGLRHRRGRHGLPGAVASLLEDVGELVREQAQAAAGLRRGRTGAEEDPPF
jgi:hypothetical protein